MYALNEQSYQAIPNEVVCITDNSGTDFMRWIDALKSDNILALINKGEMYARLFMKYRGYKAIAETTQCGTKLKLAAVAAEAALSNNSTAPKSNQNQDNAENHYNQDENDDDDDDDAASVLRKLTCKHDGNDAL